MINGVAFIVALVYEVKELSSKEAGDCELKRADANQSVRIGDDSRTGLEYLKEVTKMRIRRD